MGALSTITTTKTYRKVFVVVIVLVLTGCSFVNGIVQQQVGDLIARDLLLLDANSYGEAVAISQRVKVDIKSNAFSLIQQVEIDRDEIRLVGVTHFGSPFFTLRYYEGKVHATKMEQLPDAFRPELVLRDFQFAFWNVDVLREAYQKVGYLVVDSELTRVLQKDGEKVMSVTYQNTSPLNGGVQLIHHGFGYQIEFETLDVQQLENEQVLGRKE